MKKYWRLILILITCFSFFLMFAYRQKYSKMSLIFEMMNAFQFQDSEAKCQHQLFDFKRALKTDFSIQEKIAGEPSWTEIFPGIYSYSSYWLSKKTRSLLFTKNLSQNQLRKIQCKVYYDDRTQVDQPKTNIILIEKNDTRNFIFFECIPLSSQVPHSISFVYRNISSIPVPVISQDSYSGHHTICVKPLPPAFVDIYKILEFLIYHSHMGVKIFIFYETGLSIKVKKLLMDIAVKDGIHILLLPWHLPFDSRVGFNNTELYFLDCLQRVVARNHSEYALKLDLKEFIVPQENGNFENLKKEFDFPTVKIHQKRFCREFRSDVIAHNLNMPFLTMLKTKFSNENSVPITVGYDLSKLRKTIVNSAEFHMWLFKKKAQKSSLISSASVVLHSYNKCGFKNEKQMDFTEDKYMWKYKDILFKSHLYVLAKEYNLIAN